MTHAVFLVHQWSCIIGKQYFACSIFCDFFACFSVRVLGFVDISDWFIYIYKLVFLFLTCKSMRLVCQEVIVYVLFMFCVLVCVCGAFLLNCLVVVLIEIFMQHNIVLIVQICFCKSATYYSACVFNTFYYARACCKFLSNCLIVFYKKEAF